MRDLEELERRLRRGDRDGGLRALAESEDGKKLGAMLDGRAVEQAARSGDGEALRRMLSSVLATQEGRRLAKQVQELMEKRTEP